MKVSRRIPPLSTTKLLLQLPCSKAENKYIIYCPTYLRLEISTIKELSFENLQAKIKANIKLDIDITGLPPKIVEIIKTNLRLNSHQDDQLFDITPSSPGVTMKFRKFKLYSGEVRETIGYVIKRVVTARIIPNIFLTPFETLEMILSITVENIHVWEPSEKQTIAKLIYGLLGQGSKNYIKNEKINQVLKSVVIKFNCMDFDFGTWYVNDETKELESAQAQVIFKNANELGSYQIAVKKIDVQYSNNLIGKRLEKEEKLKNSGKNPFYKWLINIFYMSPEEEIENMLMRVGKENYADSHEFQVNEKLQTCKFHSFHCGHFNIPLYRLPVVSMFLTFFPFWLLGLVNLFIFFTPTKFDVRVTNIGMIMLAYITFLTVVRVRLPISPRITLIEILLYLEIVSTVFCMIQSYIVRYDQKAEDFLRKDSFLFLFCSVIQVLELLIFLGLNIVFWFCWKPSYKIKPGLEIGLNLNEWSNLVCDEYFRAKLESTNIRMIQFPKKHVF